MIITLQMRKLKPRDRDFPWFRGYWHGPFIITVVADGLDCLGVPFRNCPRQKRNASSSLAFLLDSCKR